MLLSLGPGLKTEFFGLGLETHGLVNTTKTTGHHYQFLTYVRKTRNVSMVS